VNISDLRRNYTMAGLSEQDLSPSPFTQFAVWFEQAVAAGICEPNAMTLATATADGMPSARIVLLKGFDERGFVFYTNYESAKGREMERNPQAALVFHWCELERQVRIAGTVERVSAEESDAYFHSRPPGSRLGAWASAQSQVVPSREFLEAEFQAFDQRFGQQAIPRPEHWGGYRVAPRSVEFWQGRPSRLHDRLRYRLEGDSWIVERLSP
jgi:pyridoxamine 5'-phosphate oxidase